MIVSNSNSYFFHKMNTRGNASHERVGPAAEGNHVPPQAPVEGVAKPVNPAGLTNAEVREYLTQMAYAITMQAQVITAQVN